MIITKSRKMLVAVLMASCLILPLHSQSLKDLLNKAQLDSNTVKDLDLRLEQSMLTINMNDLTRGKTYSINPIVTVVPASNGSEIDTYTFGGNGNLLSFNFPGTKHLSNSEIVYDDTNLYFDFGSSVFYDKDDASVYSSMSPSVQVDHTFLYGDYDTIREDSTDQINLLTVDQTYRSGMIDYKISVLKMVRNLIVNDQNQEELKNNIEIAELAIKNKLDLEMYNESTVGYKADMLSLNSLNNSLSNSTRQRVQLETRFKDYTGFSYEGVDSIDVPDLDIAPMQEESLSVQLSMLQLQLAQNTIDEIAFDENRSSLLIAGSEELTYNNYSISYGSSIYDLVYESDDKFSNTVAVNLNYTADDFSILGSAKMTTEYDGDEWTSSPSFTLGGSWTNDSTQEYDVIESKKNANKLIETQSDLSSTLSDDSFKRTSLKADIDTWNFTYTQLLDNMELAEENNKLTKQLFDLGLKNQAELDKSTFDLNQMIYDEKITLIDGWLNEFYIEALNL